MSSIPLILPDANPHERLLFADEEEEDDITDVDGTTATATATAAAATLQTRPKYSKPPRRHASLLSRDIALSAVLAVQLAAFVHVMAGRWTFPETWLRRLRWLNLLALDPWQFGRLQTTGAYVSVAGGETDSSLAPFSYRYILAGWLAVYALLVGGYALGVYLAGLDCHPDTARRVAIVRRVVYLVVQVVAFPSAIAVARLLHCRTDGTVDTMNQLSCYAAEHWCYIGVGVAVVLAVQFTVAWRMRVDARHNLRGDTDSRRRHERLLRQKALEYENAVDMSWCTDGYEWFASFGHRAALTRPLTLVAGVLVATVYSFCFDEQFVEATLLASSFALVLVICLLSPPYRVSLCNWLLCSTLSSCMVTCVLGSLITGSATGTNVWLQPDYLQRLLATVYGFQVALWLLVFAYLTVRLCLRRRRRRRMSSSRRGVKSKRWLCCGEMVKSVAAKPDSSLWPADNPKPMHRKYVYDIKRARNLIGLFVYMVKVFI